MAFPPELPLTLACAGAHVGGRSARCCACCACCATASTCTSLHNPSPPSVQIPNELQGRLPAPTGDDALVLDNVARPGTIDRQ